MAATHDWPGLNADILEEWGEEVTYAGSGAPTVLAAVVHQSVTAESRSPGSITSAFFRASDLPYDPRAKLDTLSVGAVVYQVDRVDKDDDGTYTLLLRKQ